MKKDFLIWLVCLVVILLVGLIFSAERQSRQKTGASPNWPWFSVLPKNEKGQLEAKIKSQIQEANYCAEDSDCKIESFGCPFGCNVYVNQQADLSQIRQEIKTYRESYGDCIYDCDRAGSPVCQNGQCLKAQTLTLCAPETTYRSPNDCLCPEGTERLVTTVPEAEESTFVCRTKTVKEEKI